MPRPGGYATWTGVGPVVECDTCRCAHCGGVVILRPREAPPGHCLRCMAPTCARCTAAGRCTPFERQLERMEARDRLRRAVCG